MTNGLRISMGLGLATLAVLAVRDLGFSGTDFAALSDLGCRVAELVAGLWR